jgi:hypothetical protein
MANNFKASMRGMFDMNNEINIMVNNDDRNPLFD